MKTFDTLVLSGGSSKNIMMLGALQYTHDSYMIKNIINYIGTSAGAMICYLLIIGFTPKEILIYICTNQIMEKIHNFNIVSMMNGVGATTFSNIQEHLEKMTISKVGKLLTLRELSEIFNKNFICVTYNLSKNETEYLSKDTYPELPCIVALRMTSNLPLIFENYLYDNNFYIDGGITDNFAIDIADKIGKEILGIYSDEENNNDSSTYNDSNIIEYIYKLMFIPINQTLNSKIMNASDKCKIIRLCNRNIKFFSFNMDTKTKLEMFSDGYNYIKTQF